MGYPAATGRGTSRTDAMRARDLASKAFWRREIPQEFQLSLNRDEALIFFRRAVHGIVGERWEGGSRRLKSTGRCVLTASQKNGPPAPAAFSLAQ
jgi:hypothetical protein